MNDNETQWTPTRRGGVRRTRVAQQLGTAEVVPAKAEGVATPGVGAGMDTPSTLEERHPNTVEVGGSSPSPRTQFIFKMNERLGLPTCPYLVRWRIETPWFSVRLHHWLAPDDDRAKHDHPWNFVTFVLKGGYTDVSPAGSQHLKAPAVQYRSAEHQHTVFPDAGGCWTIIVTSKKLRPWGFWVNGKFKKANKYFLTFGHHPCD